MEGEEANVKFRVGMPSNIVNEVLPIFGENLDTINIEKCMKLEYLAEYHLQFLIFYIALSLSMEFLFRLYPTESVSNLRM